MSKPSGAKRSTQHHRIWLWCIQHVRALKTACWESRITSWASVSTCLVIGFAMALPLGLSCLLKNISTVNSNWHHQPTISLYLSTDTHLPSPPTELITQIKAMPNIASIQYISPEQGLNEFQQQAQHINWLNTLSKNPLPGVIMVTPTPGHHSIAALKTLEQQLQLLPDVDLVQLDTRWVTRLEQILWLGERFTWALALLFGFGVVLTVANTIRLTTQYHQEEVTVLNLIGASPAFIRRPLLYRGAIYGGVGSLIAIFLVFLLLHWLQAPIHQLAASYDYHFALRGFALPIIMIILLFGTTLGTLGAGLAFARHLQAAK